ncbi:uncharacterized protein NECHADRAFT_55444 [Fusarium vanettenii 77-13-4]|uniref:SMP-30/Gluconolactonase/LRE-like region domain-containing protein n=1 Tax=Fusarium vanettenii (strain ATCC MYA-4622 / CBS 123669 / FGSC 9596 / NRRL 45880 / 77-13-4) TaxID=660122 RepID=C7ZND1_FUSV7|nr:uncharacterized protein NECHADRAFT_55444 [Fusarium vanettenii 77-13-4]EEU34473.1 hypothetical protein NECHADRAFT_55444 [Fusarium vanettenii 77-13-4]
MQQQAAISTIFQLNSSGSWFENLAIRPDGQIIATRMDVPELWLINPITRKGRSLLTIPGVSGAIGISQQTSNTYIVGAGNVTADPFNFKPRSMKIFLLEFKGGYPDLKLVTELPEAMFINGITPWSKTEVLVSDTVLGAVYQIDIRKGSITSIMSDTDFAGINGIRVQNGFLYYASTSNQTFFRVPITKDFAIAGSVEIILSGIFMDDFALTPEGIAYIATVGRGEIIRVDPDGNAVTVGGAATSLDIAGGTSARLATSKGYGNILYVTTNGGLGAPVNGSVTEPAKVVAVKLS